MYGPDANFPGPPMPQLDVDRNIVVLLGSYLANLNLQLQRLSPLMSRAGDLMQREAKLQNEAERNLTKELANNLGKALEDVSRASGTVAHLFKNLDMGSASGQGRVNPNSYDDVFKALIQEAGVVRGGRG